MDNKVQCETSCRNPELKASKICCFACELRGACKNQCDNVSCKYYKVAEEQAGDN